MAKLPSWIEGKDNGNLAFQAIDALRHVGYDQPVSDGVVWYFELVSSLLDRAKFYAQHNPTRKEFELTVLNPYAGVDCRFSVWDAQTGERYSSEGIHVH